MGWIIALVVVTGLAILPLGVSAVYNTSGPKAWLLFGPVRIAVWPKKPKESKSENDRKSAKAKSSQTVAKKEEKQGGSAKEFFPLLQIILDFLGVFRRKLRVKHLQLKLILAADDPGDLAINYGRAWAALGNLMPQLERLFVIKNRNLEVECSFTSDETLIFARIDLTITLGRLLCLSVPYGFRVLREYLKIIKLKKGGANI